MRTMSEAKSVAHVQEFVLVDGDEMVYKGVFIPECAPTSRYDDSDSDSDSEDEEVTLPTVRVDLASKPLAALVAHKQVFAELCEAITSACSSVEPTKDAALHFIREKTESAPLHLLFLHGVCISIGLASSSELKTVLEEELCKAAAAVLGLGPEEEGSDDDEGDEDYVDLTGIELDDQHLGEITGVLESSFYKACVSRALVYFGVQDFFPLDASTKVVKQWIDTHVITKDGPSVVKAPASEGSRWYLSVPELFWETRRKRVEAAQKRAELEGGSDESGRLVYPFVRTYTTEKVVSTLQERTPDFSDSGDFDLVYLTALDTCKVGVVGCVRENMSPEDIKRVQMVVDLTPPSFRGIRVPYALVKRGFPSVCGRLTYGEVLDLIIEAEYALSLDKTQQRSWFEHHPLMWEWARHRKNDMRGSPNALSIYVVMGTHPKSTAWRGGGLLFANVFNYPPIGSSKYLYMHKCVTNNGDDISLRSDASVVTIADHINRVYNGQMFGVDIQMGINISQVELVQREVSRYRGIWRVANKLLTKRIKQLHKKVQKDGDGDSFDFSGLIDKGEGAMNPRASDYALGAALYRAGVAFTPNRMMELTKALLYIYSTQDLDSSGDLGGVFLYQALEAVSSLTLGKWSKKALGIGRPIQGKPAWEDFKFPSEQELKKAVSRVSVQRALEEFCDCVVLDFFLDCTRTLVMSVSCEDIVQTKSGSSYAIRHESSDERHALAKHVRRVYTRVDRALRGAKRSGGQGGHSKESKESKKVKC